MVTIPFYKANVILQNDKYIVELRSLSMKDVFDTISFDSFEEALKVCIKLNQLYNPMFV